MQKAIEYLKEGYTLALVGDNGVYLSKKRGVEPLLYHIEQKTDLRGFFCADKVVGKAAAYLYVLLGVREIYCLTMSLGAREVLERYGIQYTAESTVPYIINRNNDGPCPMESAVANALDPENALALIQKRLLELKSD